MKIDKNIKILFVSPTSPPFGGIAKWTEMILKNGLTEYYNIKLVNTRLYSKRNELTLTKINFLELKRTARILYNLIKKLLIFRPHIVHICLSVSPFGIIRAYISMLLSKAVGAKIVTHYHSNIHILNQNALKGLSYKVLIRLINASNANLALNMTNLKFIKEIKLRTSKYKNDFLVPNFIDDMIFKEHLSEKKTDKKNTKIRAIYVGDITHQKGVYDIIQISKEFSNVEFICIGNVLDDFKNKINILPANVTLLPPVSNIEIFSELKKSDLFIFLSYSEGFPYAVLEAMAIGLPIVATTVGAIPEMIQEGKGGCLCPPGNIDMAKDALNRLINHDNYAMMGNINIAKVQENYIYSKVIMKLCRIYEECLKK